MRGPIARLMLTIAVGVVAFAGFMAAETARAEPERPPAPELAPSLGWVNTDRPLSLGEDLRGHVVLLDFWTYCCINCMHVLPDLEYLEAKYADEPFVVIGVHSAKFDAEGKPVNVEAAAARYDIHHPVVVDKDFAIWRQYGARAWPTFALIDSRGRLVGTLSGEGHRHDLDGAIQALLQEGRADGTLAEKHIDLPTPKAVRTESGLRFPGKVLVAGDRLFVADSSNDRVIEAELPDAAGNAKVLRVFGDGKRGLLDGKAPRFHDPQGMAYDVERGVLYVADTKNHAVRAIDLERGVVETIAGDGEQGNDRRGGVNGRAQRLSSPWALALSHDAKTLYVAMAGTHQLWSVDVRTKRAVAVAGTGIENVYDGPAKKAALAQPSGLALSGDGKTVYVMDTEGSAVRAYDTQTHEVRTIIGRAVADPRYDSSLFDFGDVDGAYPDARLQHAIGVALWPSADGGADGQGDRLLIADTYNDKLKLVRTDTKTVTTWSMPALGLDEPAGLSVQANADGSPAAVFVADTNNHRVLRVNPTTGEGVAVRFVGLGAPDLGSGGGVDSGENP